MAKRNGRPARAKKVEKTEKACGPEDLGLLVELFELSSHLEAVDRRYEMAKAEALRPIAEAYGRERAPLEAAHEQIRRKLGVPAGVDFAYDKDKRTMSWLAPPAPAEKGT